MANQTPRQIVVIVPRCPSCRSTNLKTNGSRRVAGVQTQWKLCRGCGWRFRAILQ